MAGDGADNVAKQSGGWTLTWQGTGYDNSKLTGATSIWKGIQSAVTAAGGVAEGSPLKASTRHAPTSRSSYSARTPTPSFRGTSRCSACATATTVTSHSCASSARRRSRSSRCSISGRPLWMNREINASNAFVAAWLPGSEGAGIADVLYRKKDGAVAWDFTGRLAFSWPRTVLHEPIKFGQPGYNPLFPLGYGLRYADSGNLPPLPEAPGADIESSQAGIFFQRGKISPPWLLSYSDERIGTQPLSSVPSTVADGRIRVSRVDLEAQEDSLRLQWLTPSPDGGMTGVQLDSREAFDFGREANGDILLILTVRVGAQPTAPVDLAMACGSTCRGSVRFDPLLKNVPAGVRGASACFSNASKRPAPTCGRYAPASRCEPREPWM